MAARLWATLSLSVLTDSNVFVCVCSETNSRECKEVSWFQVW